MSLSFFAFIIPLLIFSLFFKISLHSDKYFSNFSFVFVTLFFNLSIKLFCSSNNFFLFSSKKSVTFLFVLCYKLSILIISSWTSLLKFKICSLTLSKSLEIESKVKFSFFKVSSSLIKISLWPSWGFKNWQRKQHNSFSFKQNKFTGLSGWIGHLVTIGT